MPGPARQNAYVYICKFVFLTTGIIAKSIYKKDILCQNKKDRNDLKSVKMKN